MSVLRRPVLLTTLALAALLAGCGGTVVDDAKTEGALQQSLSREQGKKVKSVECPSGVEVEPGATFECTVELAGGERETATIEIRNEDADLEVTRLQPAE